MQQDVRLCHKLHHSKMYVCHTNASSPPKSKMYYWIQKCLLQSRPGSSEVRGNLLLSTKEREKGKLSREGGINGPCA